MNALSLFARIVGFTLIAQYALWGLVAADSPGEVAWYCVGVVLATGSLGFAWLDLRAATSKGTA